MTRTDLRVAALLLASALAASQSHAAPVIKTELDRESVPEDETAVLTVTVPSDCEVERPTSADFDVVSFDSQLLGQGESLKKLQPLQNKFSRATPVPTLGARTATQWRRRVTFELHPLLVGRIKIPPLAVTCPEGRGKTASQLLTALASRKAEVPQASSEDAILYKPVSIGGTDPKPNAPAPAPPAPGLLARPEIPAPSPGPFSPSLDPPPQAVTTSPPFPQGAPDAPPSSGDRPGAPAPGNVAAKHADQVASYVQGFAKGVAGAVQGKDEKLASAGKDLATAGKTVASIVKTIFLALVALLGAAAVVWGAYRGVKAYMQTRHYEGLRLKVRSMVAPPQKEDHLIGGKYRSLTELGEGGMGTVLLAEDIKLGRKVALKRLHAEARFELKLREKLVEEARIISQLNHPYIVGIHEVLETGDEIYLVFDYVEGRPLSRIIDERKKLPLKECLDIFGNICQAIDYAHKKNVLHLDIKPSNIMVDANGFAKVMDFGLAKREAREDSFSGVGGSGTFWYMAPEQHSGVTSPAADVYALAVTIYETLTGAIPFAGPDFVRQKDHLLYVPAATLAPELPAEIDLVFADAFNPQMTKRLPGALQLLERLKALPPAGPPRAGGSAPAGESVLAVPAQPASAAPGAAEPFSRLPMAPDPNQPAAKPRTDS